MKVNGYLEDFLLRSCLKFILNINFKVSAMRKIIIGALSLFIACACTNEEYVLESVANQETGMSNTRSMSEVLQIANNAAQLLQGAQTRSVIRTVDPIATQYVITPSTRNAGGNDTLLYIVNYVNEQGFAVISANRQAEGLLAVVEQGSYGVDGKYYTDNPGFTAFMEQAEAYARSIQSLPPIIDEGNVPMEQKIINDTTYNNTIEPLVGVRWGQTGVECKYCPNGYAGCSNVAMAQIMSYFQHPLNMNITYPGASITSLNLNWTAIKKHKVDHSYQNCAATNDAHEAISLLMRQLGVLNKSNYGIGGTSTVADNVRRTFAQLGYNVSSSVMNYTDQSFETLIADGKLLYVRGDDRDMNTGRDSGHGWIADGASKLSVHSTMWVRPIHQLEWTLHTDFGITTTEYVHYNWGWDGNCNGYFVAGIFNPNRSNDYDNENLFYSNSSGYNYTNNIMFFTVTR